MKNKQRWCRSSRRGCFQSTAQKEERTVFPSPQLTTKEKDLSSFFLLQCASQLSWQNMSYSANFKQKQRSPPPHIFNDPSGWLACLWNEESPIEKSLKGSFLKVREWSVRSRYGLKWSNKLESRKRWWMMCNSFNPMWQQMHDFKMACFPLEQRIF